MFRIVVVVVEEGGSSCCLSRKRSRDRADLVDAKSARAGTVLCSMRFNGVSLDPTEALLLCGEEEEELCVCSWDTTEEEQELKEDGRTGRRP